jgi:hypothetical protein
VFYLSYLKIPIHAWKKIRRIQREFLWGGRRGRNKVSWIKWDTVCLPKKKGGLGVRDVRMVNISLLTKWRWRLLDNSIGVWKDVLKSKYGDNVVGRVELEDDCKPWFSSLWWRDVCSIGSNLDINWFSQNVVKKLGNGIHTSFWCDIWIGHISLKEAFPRLFLISTQKEASVADLWNLTVGEDRWRLNWRRRLFVWEQNLLHELLEVIDSALLTDAPDRWGWRPDNGDGFTVNSTYKLLSNLSNTEVLMSPWHTKIFCEVWKSPTPSKVCGFVWQLLHNRIPSKDNLVVRRILVAGNDSLCSLCGLENETAAYLFIYCNVAKHVWSLIFAWLKVPFYLPHNLFSIFNCLLVSGNPKTNRGRLMICCATVWMIWKFRNGILFDNNRGTVAELVESVKVASWKWWLARSKKGSCLFYEWRAEPGICMLY